MTTIVAQVISSAEVRAVIHASMLADDITVSRVSMDSLRNCSLSVDYVPVGSVEYVREFMRCCGISEPKLSPYPTVLQEYLHRSVRISTAFDIQRATTPLFIKPVSLKRFNGFVMDFKQPTNMYDAHDAIQLKIVSGSISEKIWVSDVVSWQCEWRVYIDGNTVCGYGRYDPDGLDNAPMIDLTVVQSAIDKMYAAGYTYPYTLDFGVLSSGETALVEANDFWAIGYYPSTMSSTTYVNLLVKRWRAITQSAVHPSQ